MIGRLKICLPFKEPASQRSGGKPVTWRIMWGSPCLDEDLGRFTAGLIVAGSNDLTLRCAPPLHIRRAVGLPVHTDAISAVEDVHSELSEIDAGAAIVEHRSLVVDGELKDASKRT